MTWVSSVIINLRVYSKPSRCTHITQCSPGVRRRACDEYICATNYYHVDDNIRLRGKCFVRVLTIILRQYNIKYSNPILKNAQLHWGFAAQTNGIFETCKLWIVGGCFMFLHDKCITRNKLYITRIFLGVE